MPVNKCKPQKEMKEWKYTKQINFGRVREFEYLKDSVQDDKTINIFLKNSGHTMKNEGVKKIPRNKCLLIGSGNLNILIGSRN